MKKRAKWKGRTPEPVVVERLPRWFENAGWTSWTVIGVGTLIVLLVAWAAATS